MHYTCTTRQYTMINKGNIRLPAYRYMHSFNSKIIDINFKKFSSFQTVLNDVGSLVY